MEETLKRLEEAEKERTKYTKRQYYMSAVAAACCLLMLALIASAYFTLMPRLRSSISSIDRTAQNLAQVSQELSEADLTGMVHHVDQMAVTSEEGVRNALEKIDAINIDALNGAISALSDAVTPFANFVRTFR